MNPIKFKPIPSKIAASLLSLAVLAAVSSAPAQVLLTDNVNVDAGSNDANFELSNGRMGGTQALSPYDEGGGAHQVGNTGTDVGQPGGPSNGHYLLLAGSGTISSQTDLAAASTGPLIVDFDMYFHGGPNHDGGVTSDWGAFGLRTGNQTWPVAGTGEFGFLTRYSGGIQVFQNGGSIQPSGWDTTGFAMADHWKLIFTDTAGTGSAFVGNGSKVTIINGTNTLGTLTLGQLKSEGLNPGWQNYANMYVGVANISNSVVPATVTRNLSFEQNVAPTAGTTAVVPAGWLPFNKQDGGDFGSQNAGGTDYTIYDPLSPPADGNQFLYLNMFAGTGTGGIYQDMGPLLANHTYTLTVAIGSRADRLNSPGIISLVNGTDDTGAVLATTNGLPATQNTWQDYTVTYTTGGSVRGDLTVVLSVAGASTIQANFDNVRLNAPNNTPPPLPVRIQNIVPSYAETVVGDQVVFSAAYSNSPPVALQWQQVISGSATNDIDTGVVNVTNNGVITSTLTLTNVQIASSGTYRLQALNATNSAGYSYTLGTPLVVGATPPPVNNVIVDYAGQTFSTSIDPGYFPDWPVNTNELSLVAGFQNGSGPGTFSAAGDFAAGNNCNPDPTILDEGFATNLTSVPNEYYCAGGTLNLGIGYEVTYTLNTSTYGMDITNITVFGGWQDGGRDEQKYQVLYSTVQAPATLIPLLIADYLPNNPNNQPCVTRTTLVPASGVLAHNVATVQISWNLSPTAENGWEGYDAILVGGQPSVGFSPSLTNDIAPTTASDVVGSQISMTAGFSGATSLQWQKNGTNIPGATSTTLKLNNIHTNDAGVYSLVAFNSVGQHSSSGCTVTVNPAPAAVSNIITSVAAQTSIQQVFTPTWDPAPLSSSLFYGASPSSSGEGDFTGGSFNIATGGNGTQVLTDGTYGTIDFNQSGDHAWVTCMGSGTTYQNGPLLGGQYVVFTLPTSANGYDITNIMTAGGWNDGGRDEQAYTVNYATADNPTYFTPLVMVDYNPTNPVGYSMSRETLTAANGVLATNVVALEFDMTTPAGENGFSGYSEIAAYGKPSANPPPLRPSVTVQHEEISDSFTLAAPNLIANQLPSSTGPGTFTEEGCNETNLTSGILGFGYQYGASCGDDGTAVPWLIFSSTNGWNLTNIVVYTMWHDYGRDGQFYNLSYSTLAAPTTFVPLTSIAYNPAVPHNGTATGNEITIAPIPGQTLLASNVYSVMFDFTPQGTQDYGWSGYTQIVLQGEDLTIPLRAPVVATTRQSGGNLIVTGTGGTPHLGYVWITSTNLATPLANWSVAASGTLDGTGSFSNSIPVNVAQPGAYFTLWVP